MSTLFDECLAAGKEYEQHKEEIESKHALDKQQKWDTACDQAKTTILEDYEEKMKQVAGTSLNRRAKLYEWQHGDSVKFNDFYLLTLLKRGDLLEKLQAHFDEKHSTDTGRKFMVYFRQIRTSKKRSLNKYAVFVSWETDKFDEIAKEIQESRERPQYRSRPVRKNDQKKSSEETDSN